MKQGDVVAEKYLLEEPLGEGGMGVVWLAYHRFLERRVAIKFLYPHLLSGAAKGEVREKFFQEARIGDRLRHPNIVEVRDIDSYKGVFFIVMEYIEGRDLRKVIEGKPLSEDRIGAYTSDVLGALAGAVSGTEGGKDATLRESLGKEMAGDERAKLERRIPKTETSKNVIIKDGKLVPATISIPRGGSIIWVNTDSSDHVLYFFGEAGTLLEPGEGLEKRFEFRGRETYRIKDLTDEGWYEVEGNIIIK